MTCLQRTAPGVALVLLAAAFTSDRAVAEQPRTTAWRMNQSGTPRSAWRVDFLSVSPTLPTERSGLDVASSGRRSAQFGPVLDKRAFLVSPVRDSTVRQLQPATESLVPTWTQTAPQEPKKSWIGRHPLLFGALVGLGVGCVAGAAQVGGSEDTVANALDEFACPVVGGIGAGIGTLAGWALSR